jgi:hypothetical protein
MRKISLALALSILTGASTLWAVPVVGTAHFNAGETGAGSSVPAPIRFRLVRDRGLLVTAWLNGSGPYTLAIDTGAGVSIISNSAILRAGIPTQPSHRTLLGGLGGSAILSDREATIREVALGEQGNVLPAHIMVTVAADLPSGLDGILDPTEAFSPLGYSIDLPNRELEAFDSRSQPLHMNDVPADGTVVHWIRERTGHRPFVRLRDGRLVLLDTGSSFGFAINETAVPGGSNDRNRGVRDLSGRVVQSRRVGPTTVSLGDLVLGSVPTDLLTGVASGTPIILGRDALYPFRITFDPLSQLISIAPSQSR